MSSGQFPTSLTPSRLLRHFWHGIFIIAPILLTIATLYWVFEKVDGILRPYVRIPGVGFVLVLAAVVFIGWFTSFFLMRRVVRGLDRWIEQTPGVSFVYSSIRDFFDAFVGNKRRFTKAVLVNVLAEEVWLVGFLTDEKLANLQLTEDYVSVYVPQAYNVAGQLYLVKRERVRPIDHLASSDVMKYAVTGGAVDIVAPKTG
jgi:uncharacterized membrane protein